MKNTDLPWLIDISYYLDGVERAPSELAGKTGGLLIRLKTRPNAEINPVFFENYLLQVSVTLDASRSRNIVTDGGSMVNIANAGRNRLITFTLMPGESSEISLGADVVGFTMPGIELAALPSAMQIDAPDTRKMKDDLTALSDAIASLNDGVSQLAEGAHEISSGANELTKGSQSYHEGLSQLNAESANLTGASSQINKALGDLAASLLNQTQNGDIGSIAELPAALKNLASGLDGISTGLSGLKEGFVQAHTALSLEISNIPDGSVSEQDLAALYGANPDKKELIDQLAGYYAAAKKVKGTYEAVRHAFAALEGNLGGIIESSNTISASLKSIAAQTEDAIENDDAMAQITKLTTAITELSNMFGGFHEGLVSYTGGLNTLTNEYALLHNGLSGIAAGTEKLHEGIEDLHEGTAELKDETRGMPEQFESEVDKMIDQFDNSDFLPVSFVSPENKKTVAVQFIMRTEAIELADTAAEAEPAAERPNLWARLLNFFEIIWTL